MIHIKKKLHKLKRRYLKFEESLNLYQQYAVIICPKKPLHLVIQNQIFVNFVNAAVCMYYLF